MILNTTKKPFEQFSAIQRLALNGEPLEHRPCDRIEQFEAFYDENHEKIKAVIVDGSNFILANDIVNCAYCPVVTLHTEVLIDLDGEQHNFIQYDDSENL